MKVKSHARYKNGKKQVVREHYRKKSKKLPISHNPNKKHLGDYDKREGVKLPIRDHLSVKQPKRRRGSIDQESKRYRRKNRAAIKRYSKQYRKRNKRAINAKARMIYKKYGR